MSTIQIKECLGVVIDGPPIGLKGCNVYRIGRVSQLLSNALLKCPQADDRIHRQILVQVLRLVGGQEHVQAKTHDRVHV
jgi:hypothetical protein